MRVCIWARGSFAIRAGARFPLPPRPRLRGLPGIPPCRPVTGYTAGPPCYRGYRVYRVYPTREPACLVSAVTLDWPLARPQAGMRVPALLLVLAAIQNTSAQHINFIEFSSNGRRSGIQYDTGFNANTVELVWSKYGRRLINAVQQYKGFRVVRSQGAPALEEEVAAAFYCALWYCYLHQYPTTRGVRGWVFGRSKRSFSKKKFYQCAMVVLLALATMINEVHYEERRPHSGCTLCSLLHTRFPPSATATTPVSTI